MVCHSQEFKKTPLAATIAVTNLVVFHTESNQVAALENHCAHRNTPLSKGNK
ncbi:Rieske 2Fe-2S domain-containing protein [Microcoleus sp. FACHB-SPT15]|uniref:Rieske 2Fe-2S domain-containing protein n=1 Tax=Microcoleus sp. FACHB-SPT15 TaxID=2692830 RepID=UPI0037C5531E